MQGFPSSKQRVVGGKLMKSWVEPVNQGQSGLSETTQALGFYLRERQHGWEGQDACFLSFYLCQGISSMNTLDKVIG